MIMMKIQILLLFACLSFACCEPVDGNYFVSFRPNEYTFDKEGGEITMKLENPIFRNYKIFDIEVLLGMTHTDSLVLQALSEEERIELSLDLEKDKSWYKITKLANGDLHVWVDKNDKNYGRSIRVSVGDFSNDYGHAGGDVIIRQRK